MNHRLLSDITKNTIILCIILCIISYIAFKEPEPIIFGLIFGGSIGLLNIRLLNDSVEKSVTMTPDKASRHSFKHYIIRYIISFIVLVVAALADYLNIMATLVGLLLVKIVIIIDYAIFKKY